MPTPAQSVMQRINELAAITDEPGVITRTYGSPGMLRANALVGEWMQAAGMATRVDAIGNLIGRYEGTEPGAPALLLGSHLDTVRDAGRYDGPLGVILAIACVEQLHRARLRLSFAIEVIGFADEEGVRYQTTYLGSKALAGLLTDQDLQRTDAEGITLGEALRVFGGDAAQIAPCALERRHVLAYVEPHIEQGPVLEEHDLSVGVVTAIAGQTRARVSYAGFAGHAGTTPMHLRQDALCAAAELVLAAERIARKSRGGVATVGEITARPGASNVIPGEAQLTLDMRHGEDAARKALVAQIKQATARIAQARGLKLKWQIVHAAASVACSPALTRLLDESVAVRQKTTLRLPSGAGHDAAIMARLTPVAMLFIRCRRGISHNPAESVRTKDVEMALNVMYDFIRAFAQRHT